MGLPTWFAKTRPWSFHPAAFPFLGLALAMEPEGFHGLRSQLNRAAALVPFWRIEGAVGVEGTLHRERASVEVNISPLQAQQLALPQACVYGEHVQGLQTVSAGCREPCLYLSGAEGLDFFLVDLRGFYSLADVAWDKTIEHGLLKRLMEHYMDVVHRT